MTSHDEMLVAFMAGGLDSEAERRFDAHLLECESCWRAVREDRFARTALEAMREPVPPGLADRIRLAVEVEGRDRLRARRPRAGIAGAAAGVVLALVGGLVFWLVPSHPSSSDAVATVAHFAEIMDSTGPSKGAQGAGSGPVALGQPLMLNDDGQRIELSYYRMEGHEAVVATSRAMFPMPAGGRPVPGTNDMSWTASEGSIRMYCENAPSGPASVLVAADIPVAQLQSLLHQLNLG